MTMITGVPLTAMRYGARCVPRTTLAGVKDMKNTPAPACSISEMLVSHGVTDVPMLAPHGARTVMNTMLRDVWSVTKRVEISMTITTDQTLSSAQ